MTTAEELSRGYELQQKGRLAEAIAHYRNVLAEWPEKGEPWCYLGMALHDLKRFKESEEAYRKALQYKPKFPVAWNNLGNTLRLQGKVTEALAAFDEAQRLKPRYLMAIRNKAIALFWAGSFEEAEKEFLASLSLDHKDAESRKSLGILRLLAGRHQEGWPDYEFRLKSDPGLATLPGPRWQGEEIQGKTLVLVSEQGLGDTIQFVRYGTLLKEQFGCRVIAFVQDALVPLLSNSAELMGLDEIVGKRARPRKYDFWVPMLSLPGILKQDSSDFPANIPYVRPVTDTNNVADLLSGYGGLKIGVAWQGSPKNEADAFRSFPLSSFLPIASLRGVQLFSLQKGSGTEQLASLGKAMGVVDLGKHLDLANGAFLDTSVIMKELDLVITADTAIAHVAGALGVPVWLALPYVPDWRWGFESSTTPWYPTMRLFRQDRPGEWGPVFDKIAEEIIQQNSQVESITLPQVGTISIPFTPGEVLDRITILEVKRERISDQEKLRNVEAELSSLLEVWKNHFGEDLVPPIEVLKVHLKRVNESLWDAEDAVRDFEKKKQFTGGFIPRARSIYQLNDHRAQLKRQVNDKLGATWQEEKSYDDGKA